jgi:hypothetical protein
MKGCIFVSTKLLFEAWGRAIWSVCEAGEQGFLSFTRRFFFGQDDDQEKDKDETKDTSDTIKDKDKNDKDK